MIYSSKRIQVEWEKITGIRRERKIGEIRVIFFFFFISEKENVENIYCQKKRTKIFFLSFINDLLQKVQLPIINCGKRKSDKNKRSRQFKR